MRGRMQAGVVVVAVGCVAAGFAAADSLDATPSTPGVVVQRSPEPEHLVTAAELASLPTVRVTISAEQGHGQQHSFEGPLLWTVLDHAGAIDLAKVHDQVRQTVLVTGRDGYTAVLALGEIAPEFEAKQVILAERIDGQPIGSAHLQIVVPGDKRGGRGVHDVVRIVVSGANAAPN